MKSPTKYKFQPLHFFIPENEDGLTKWLKSLSLLSAIIALIIFTDYFLPLKEKTFTVKATAVRNGFAEIDYDIFLKADVRSGEEEFWILMDDEEMAVRESDLSSQRKGDEIILYKTPIFGINVKAHNNRDYPSVFFYPYINFYGLFLFFPIAFLLLFILMYVFKKKIDAVMSIGVINIILLVGFGFLVLFY